MPSSEIIRNIVLCPLFLTHSSLPLTLLFLPCLLFQIFEGNSNYDTPELRMVEPLLTRFIRIYPERATPAGMGLRLELLGCQIEGTKFLAISEFYLNDCSVKWIAMAFMVVTFLPVVLISLYSNNISKWGNAFSCTEMVLTSQACLSIHFTF